MKNYLCRSLILCTLLLPFLTNAVTANELQTQIQSLLNQITVLQGQLKTLTTNIQASPDSSFLIALPDSGVVPLQVTFTIPDNCVPGLASENIRQIDFGDGKVKAISTCSKESITHIYQNEGHYTASLQTAGYGPAPLVWQTQSKVMVSVSVTSITPVSKVSQCVNLYKTLVVGSTDASTNGEVTKLQQFLANSGFFGNLDDQTGLSLQPTGYYGMKTAHAVMKWQKEQGMNFVTLTSGVGPMTRAKMKCEM